MTAPSLSQAAAMSLCPLCGQDNQCAIAAGRPPQDCWCMQKVIDAQMLQTIPTDQRGKVCICPACGVPTAAASADR
jgi:hypothetical protein